jgi:hypothetical protein
MGAHIKWTEQLERSVVGLYEAGFSPHWISKEKGLGGNAVCNFLKRKKIYRERRHSYRNQRKFTLNEEFFGKVETETVAYWLGFFAADGCVESHRLISLQIQWRDKDHLQHFLDALGSNKIIYESVKNGKKYARVMLNSSMLVADLARLGVFPRKSLSLEWPIIPSELTNHFVRGYFDGDGMWHIDKSRQLRFGVIGSISFVSTLQNKMSLACNLPHTRLVEGVTRTWRVGGNNNCRRIYDFLYRDATIFLPRKYETASRILNPLSLSGDPNTQ